MRVLVFSCSRKCVHFLLRLCAHCSYFCVGRAWRVRACAAPAARMTVMCARVQVRQTFCGWLSQSVRVYAGAPGVEFEWTVGPIPIDDGLGKEVIRHAIAPRTWRESNTLQIACLFACLCQPF